MLLNKKERTFFVLHSVGTIFAKLLRKQVALVACENRFSPIRWHYFCATQKIKNKTQQYDYCRPIKRY